MRPMVIYLTDIEKMELEQILRRHSSGQQLVQRAKIILLAQTSQNTVHPSRPILMRRLQQSTNAKWHFAKPFKWTYAGKICHRKRDG